MWKKIYLYLTKNGFNVYAIGQHEGVCVAPYVVLKNNGQFSNAGVFTGYGIIDVIAFFPVGKYSEIESFRQNLCDKLKAFECGKFTGEITPDIIDDNKKAYTFSTKLQIFKRI